MQMFLEFSTDMLNLPIAYNTIVQGFIYHTLLSADADYSEYLHNRGNVLNRNLPKFFTFGRLHGSYRISGREIIFPRSACLELRSPDTGFISRIADGCKPGRIIRLGTNRVILTRCTVENRQLPQRELHAVMQTPLCFKQPDYEDCRFEPVEAREKLTENARMKWLSAGFAPEAFSLEIQFPKVEARRVQCQFKGIYVTGWETELLLRGTPEVLRFLYDAGIGARNSQGFGMFDILENTPSEDG